MSSKKFRLFAILIALCMGQIDTQGRGLCSRYDEIKKRCSVCYKSYVEPTTGGCGHVLDDSDKCLLHSWSPMFRSGLDQCNVCQIGYAATDHKERTVCVKDPTPIKNCVDTGSMLNIKTCYACQEGIPSADKKACLFWSQVKDPIAGCEVGTLGRGGQFGCLRCEKGKIWNDVTWKCASMNGHLGCLQLVRRKVGGHLVCHACDVENGYSMNKNLSCVKA